jgi:hypothetical protein
MVGATPIKQFTVSKLDHFQSPEAPLRLACGKNLFDSVVERATTAPLRKDVMRHA